MTTPPAERRDADAVPSLGILREETALLLRDEGIPEREAHRLAAELLVAMQVPRMLDMIAVTDRIIEAADSFHPVARFFVEGTPEQAHIVSALSRARQRDRQRRS